jgi:hypothetical protein
LADPDVEFGIAAHAPSRRFRTALTLALAVCALGAPTAAAQQTDAGIAIGADTNPADLAQIHSGHAQRVVLDVGTAGNPRSVRQLIEQVLAADLDLVNRVELCSAGGRKGKKERKRLLARFRKSRSALADGGERISWQLELCGGKAGASGAGKGALTSKARRGYATIRRVDRRARIGLAVPAADLGGYRKLLRSGKGPDFSSVSLAAVGHNLDRARADYDKLAGLVAAGRLAGAPIWVELGVSSAPPPAGDASARKVGLLGQAVFVHEAIEFARTPSQGGGGLVWAAWRDRKKSGKDWRDSLGLLTHGREAKPAWHVFRQALAPVAPPPPPPSDIGLGATIDGAIDAQDTVKMRDAGVEHVRFVVSWAQSQAESGGPFNWRVADATMFELMRAGIEPLPILYGSARFTGDPEDPPITSTELAGWSRFVAATVSRYREGGAFSRWVAGIAPEVEYRAPEVWQIWNEQNAVAFWDRDPDPTEYARLLAASAREIRAADPGARVMLGGMFGFPRNENSTEAAPYLRDLYAIGGVKSNFDVVASHPYAGDVTGVMEQIELLRAETVRAGDGATPMWISELGWGSERHPDPAWVDLAPGAAEQAALLEAAVNELRRRRVELNLEALTWFSWRDPDPAKETCPFCGSSGLLEHDRDPKPSFFTFRRLARAQR